VVLARRRDKHVLVTIVPQNLDDKLAHRRRTTPDEYYFVGKLWRVVVWLWPGRFEPQVCLQRMERRYKIVRKRDGLG